MSCRTYNCLYPRVSLEALGDLGDNIYFYPFFTTNKETTYKIMKRSYEHKYGWIIDDKGVLPEEFTDEVLDFLVNKLPEEINSIFFNSRDIIETSNMNNIFIRYKDKIPPECKEWLYSVSMPDPWNHLDSLKHILNTEVKEGGILQNITDEIMVEDTTIEALYKDPIVNITTSLPEKKHKYDDELDLYYLINIPIIKGSKGKVRFVSYRVNLEK